MAERAIPGVDTGWMAPDGTFFGDRDCDGEAKQKADAYVGVEGVAQRVTVATDTPETWKAVAAVLAPMLFQHEWADADRTGKEDEAAYEHVQDCVRAAFIGEDAT